MGGEISEETEIQAPAAKVWELYGGPEMGEFIATHLPNLIQKIEVLEGHGGEGSVLLVTLAPGKSIAFYFVFIRTAGKTLS